MIRLTPLEQGEQLTRLCREYGVPETKNVHAYVSADPNLKAQCIFSLEKYVVTLLAIDFSDSDPLIPELLIRAVGSYAANRSGYIFNIPSAQADAIAPTLQTLRFEKNENGYSGKVPKVLAGTCQCKNNQ